MATRETDQLTTTEIREAIEDMGIAPDMDFRSSPERGLLVELDLLSFKRIVGKAVIGDSFPHGTYNPELTEEEKPDLNEKGQIEFPPGVWVVYDRDFDGNYPYRVVSIWSADDEIGALRAAVGFADRNVFHLEYGFDFDTMVRELHGLKS